MIKPDVRESEKVASWPIPVRYFWVLLWGYVDDHGKGKDNPLLVKSDCFPLDVDITGEVVDEWLWVLAESGVITRYENGGQKYLEVVNWAEHQKPQHPKPDVLPGHTADGSTRRERHEVVMKSSVEPHEVVTPELGRDGLESERELSTSEHVAVLDLFDSFWSLWPRSEGKIPARKAWEKATRKIDATLLLELARRYVEHPHRPPKQFVPHASTWLNESRWEDGEPTAREADSKPSQSDKFHATLQMGRDLQAQLDAQALAGSTLREIA
jgi:hypothetical protein